MLGRRPLDGTRILDFTWVRSGPWGTRWLAILGADVLKVEWPEPALGGFTGRSVSGTAGTRPPGVEPGINSGGDFSDTNPMKKSVTISARTPKGLALIKRLLATSDVVIENFSTGVLDSWGLSYEEMTKIKPDIIYVSMAGFGQTGRNKDYRTSPRAYRGLLQLVGDGPTWTTPAECTRRCVSSPHSITAMPLGRVNGWTCPR